MALPQTQCVQLHAIDLEAPNTENLATSSFWKGGGAAEV